MNEHQTTSSAFGGVPVSYALTPVSENADERVSQTIAVMCRYAVEDSSCPEVQEDAQSALALGGGDPIYGVWRFCKERFRFTQDADLTSGTSLDNSVKESIVEVLIRPRDIARMFREGLQAVEDCDGYSTYAASLLLALGVQPYFCTVAVDPSVPSEYSHVYVVAHRRGERIAIDSSHGEYCGWECPNPFGKRREWQVTHAPVLGYMLLGAALSFLWFAAKGSF